MAAPLTAGSATSDGDGEAEATPQTACLSQEDKQTAMKLYQTCPQLWNDFGNIVEFCDAADEDSENYDRLFLLLMKTYSVFSYTIADLQMVGRFAAAVGFAEKAVDVLQPLMNELRTTLGSERVSYSKQRCLRMLTNMLHNFTDIENEFHLRLAKADCFFSDVVACLKDLAPHFLHLMIRDAQDFTDKRSLCFSLQGILHNSCKSPEVLPVIRQFHLAQHLAVFLDKRLDKNFRLGALMLLALIVDDGQLELLELDHEQLDYSLVRARAALTSQTPGKNGFEVEELVVLWASLARLDFNRRLMVAKGVVDLLKAVLQSGTDTEKEAATAAFQQLAMDAANATIFQKNRSLVDALSAHQNAENHTIRQAVLDTLTKIREADSREEDIEENTALHEALAEQQNTLIILGVGRVEFLLDQLSDVTSDGGSKDDVTGAKALKALMEMTEDESSQREILNRGGLGVLQKLLQSGRDERILESAQLLLNLASCKEHCVVIHGNKNLMQTMQRLTQHDNEHLRQTATHVIDNVHRYVT